MKKYIFLAVAAVTLLFVSCQKNELHPSEPSGFELIANIAKTKTTLSEDFKVDWEEGDVLYMVTSDGTWGKPYNDDKSAASIAEFVYESGKFSTTSLIDPATYIFKAMYATEDQKSFHRGASSTHKLNATQSQNCADPTAEVKKNDALVGTFEAKVPMTKPAEVNMQHLYTLMRVDIKNATGASVEVKSFEMTAAGADLAAIFNVVAFDTPSLTTKQDASETITVNLAGGIVDNDASLPVYFVMAPLTNYTGDVTFKVTDSANKTYTKTVKMSGISFEAGHYNTTPYTISVADAVEPEPETSSVTWDLTEDKTSEASENKIAWDSDYVSMSSERASSQSTAANNYYPGSTTPRTSTRFYKNNSFNLIPKDGYAINSAIFEATSENYANNFVNSVWENAILSAENKTITLIPIDGTVDVTAVLGETVGFTSVVVNIVPESEYEKPESPKLTSITLSGQRTDYYVGDTFGFDGIVTANYSYGSSKIITEYTVSEPDMSSEGTKEVTVTYAEGDVTVSAKYTITLTTKPADDDKPTDGPLVWTLVTNVSDLAVGDEIIIAAKDYAYAIGSASSNGNNRTQVSITKSDNTLTSVDGANILTLQEGSVSGTYALYTGSKYLYAASTSSNYLKEKDSKDENGSWKITVSSDGTALLVAQGKNTRNTIQYNQSSGLFACYSSASQKAVVIYKQMPSSGDVGGTTPDPTPDPEQPEDPETPSTGDSASVEMKSFTATSASMDENVSYTTAKGGGTSEPAINDGEIRLYQNSSGGGSITITVKDGYKLQSVTIGSSMKTKVAYTKGDGTTKSASSDLAANGKYTVDDIAENSITFHCMGADKNSRLYVNYLSVTYQAN